MTICVYVALDLLREAIYRRWILAMVGTISLLALVLAYSLQLELVDGVIAGTRFFGDDLGHEVRTANSLLRPLLTGASWVVYVGGLLFGILACSNFAPELLAPGRIEHLLSLPIQRWQLIVGTYLGVMLVALLGASYASGVFTLLIGLKAGVWSLALFGSGLAGCLAFAAIYGAMLVTATFVRSPGLSAGAGALLLALGSALPRPELAAVFDPGWQRDLYAASVSWLPRFTLLGDLGLSLGRLEPWHHDLWPAAAAAVVFGLACLAVAIWELERRDY